MVGDLGPAGCFLRAGILGWDMVGPTSDLSSGNEPYQILVYCIWMICSQIINFWTHNRKKIHFFRQTLEKKQKLHASQNFSTPKSSLEKVLKSYELTARILSNCYRGNSESEVRFLFQKHWEHHQWTWVFLEQGKAKIQRKLVCADSITHTWTARSGETWTSCSAGTVTWFCY